MERLWSVREPFVSHLAFNQIIDNQYIKINRVIPMSHLWSVYGAFESKHNKMFTQTPPASSLKNL